MARTDPQEFLDDCSCNSLLTSGICFRNVEPYKRKAVQIVLLNFIIAGLNSTSVFTLDELLALGKCCDCDLSDNDYDVILTYMLWQLAISVGSEVPLVTGTLIDQACKLQYDEKVHKGIWTVLLCKFFQAVNNPLLP